MALEYQLSIFSPGAKDAPWVDYTSPTPFMGISVGDILRPQADWPGTSRPDEVKVTAVEHMISADGDRIQHRIRIFTQYVLAGTL